MFFTIGLLTGAKGNKKETVFDFNIVSMKKYRLYEFFELLRRCDDKKFKLKHQKSKVRRRIESILEFVFIFSLLVDINKLFSWAET